MENNLNYEELRTQFSKLLNSFSKEYLIAWFKQDEATVKKEIQACRKLQHPQKQRNEP